MSEISVVHVITSLDVGGAQRTLLNLVTGLDRSEFAPTVVSIRPAGRMAKDFRDVGVAVHELGVSSAWQALAGLGQLRRLLRRERPALVQTWMYHADLFGGLAGATIGAFPVIWNLRQSTLDRRSTKRATRVIAWTCAKLSSRIPARIVCASESGRRAHAALGYDSAAIEVIPNGVDVDTFRPMPGSREWLRQELRIPATAEIVGLVARFDPQKDHRTFAIAAGRLRHERPDVRFVLCGEGIEAGNQTLGGWLHEHGLADVTALLGARADVPRILSGLDLVVSTSAFGEGFPNAIAEAMACEVPCVATDVGDAEAIMGGIGELVPPRVPEASASAWGRWLDLDPAGRAQIGAAARARVAQHFSLSAMIERYAVLYRRMASRVRV